VGADVLVRFVDDGGAELGSSLLGAPLLPGGETFVTLSYRAPSAAQLPTRIRAVVDADAHERECVESNNQRDVEVKPATSVPELRVSAASSGNSCPVRTLNVQVFNDSPQPVPSVDVGFYAGNPAAGAKLLKTVSVTQVPASGAAPIVSVPLNVGSLDVTVYVVVDPENALLECNDGNNTALTDVFCQPFAI
jgi:hypothetical protein